MRTAHARVTSRAALRGDLLIVVHDAAPGRVVRRIIKRNTITYAGLNSALYLWAQNGIVPTDYQFAKLVPGTNATPPTRGDLAMGAPLGPSDQIVLAPANRVVSPSTGELIVSGTLGTGQANGSTLTEIGIELGNASLFARQIHPGFPKTIAFTVTYTWRVAMTTTS